MPYLIDGHNLIPKLGLHLDALDDEDELISRLQEFCRLRRERVDIYFDGASPGPASTRKTGAVVVHFAPRGSSADAAIEFRLARLGKAAKNWTIVSSDRRIRCAAAAAHAGVLSSEEFAREMTKARAIGVSARKHEATLAPGEVEEWLEFFNKKRG